MDYLAFVKLENRPSIISSVNSSIRAPFCVCVVTRIANPRRIGGQGCREEGGGRGLTVVHRSLDNDNDTVLPFALLFDSIDVFACPPPEISALRVYCDDFPAAAAHHHHAVEALRQHLEELHV